MTFSTVFALMLAQAAPASSWIVTMEPDRCVMTRKYGNASVFIDWTPLSRRFEVVISDAGRALNPVKGNGSFSFGEGTLFEGRFEKGMTLADDRRVISLDVPGEPDKLSSARALSIKGAGIETDAYPVGEASKIVSAFRQCREAFIDYWKIDRAALARVAKPAELINPATWISKADLPDDAINRAGGGTTISLMNVDTVGKLTCRMIGTSGEAALDTSLCASVEKHGRFRPARAADGTAVSGWNVARVKFRALLVYPR